MTEYGGPETAAETATHESERWVEPGARVAAEPAEPAEAAEGAESAAPEGSAEPDGPADAAEPVVTAAPTSEAEAEAEAEAGSDAGEDEDGEEPDEIPDPELEAQFEPADPQEWINQLIQELLHAEQGIGAGPRDALMARIKLAQAYSEFGDSVSAAPLAVENVLQAEQLFPASESWLRGLREFRDAVCESAGWTASQMRQAEPIFEAVPEPVFEPVSEPVAESVAEPVADAIPHTGPAAEDVPQPAFVVVEDEFDPAPPAGEDYVEDAVLVTMVVGDETVTDVNDTDDGEFVISDVAAYEEIIRLRYELRDARRTIARLRHVNGKLREALAFDEG